MSRTVNIELSQYMIDANARMQDAAGVSYSEVCNDLHGGTAGIRVAFETNVPVADFVDTVIEDAGFVSTAAVPSGDAREINLRAAALMTFSRSNPGWLPVQGGGVICATGRDDIYLVAPSRTESGHWGFEARRMVQGEAAPHGSKVSLSSDTEFQSVGGGIDITDAISAYELALRHEDTPQGMRP